MKYLQEKAVPLVLQKVAKYLNPALGGFDALWGAVQWLTSSGESILTATNSLLAKSKDLLDPANVQRVADEAVVPGLKAALGAILDFAAIQVGVGKIPQGIVDGVKKLREPWERKLREFAKKVTEKVVALWRGDLPGTPSEYAGAASAIRAWPVADRVGSLAYRLWAAFDANRKLKVLLANRPDDVRKTLDAWSAVASRSHFSDLAPDIKAAVKLYDEKVKPLLDKVTKGVEKLAKLAGPNGAGGPGMAAAFKEVAGAAAKELNDALTQFGDLARKVQQAIATRNCFVAGTPILTPSGSVAIEALRPGDLVLSRAEVDPEGPVRPREVEEVFVRAAAVFELRLGGQVIRTTAEHPFWVDGKGWVEAGALRPGDILLGRAGRVAVESAEQTTEEALVYNVRVQGDHTYFVGRAEWGFDAWAHNATYNFTFLSGLLLAKKGQDDPALRLAGVELADLQKALSAPIRVAGMEDDKGVTTYGYGAVGDGATLMLQMRQRWQNRPDGETLGKAAEDVLANHLAADSVKQERTKQEKTVEGRIYARYLRSGSGLDALTKSQPQYEQAMRDAVREPKTHGHHIVYKKGDGATQQQASQEAKDILWFYEIDPYKGRENLAFAPNDPSNHPDGPLLVLVVKLRKAFKDGEAKAEIVEILKQGARDWIGIPGYGE